MAIAGIAAVLSPDGRIAIEPDGNRGGHALGE
jgi:hypothetical protein